MSPPSVRRFAAYILYYTTQKNRKRGEIMTKAIMTKESEEKRLSDFKKIAEHWDELPEYAKGKLDGTISAIAALYANVEIRERKTG